MSIIFTDQEIKAFIQERKVLPDNWHNKFKKRMNRGYTEQYQDITGEDENIFRIIVKRGDYSKVLFSAILVVRIPNSKEYFPLCRYNGSNHQHTNEIEGESITGFHIHTATERYQGKKTQLDTRNQPHVIVTSTELFSVFLKMQILKNPRGCR